MLTSSASQPFNYQLIYLFTLCIMLFYLQRHVIDALGEQNQDYHEKLIDCYKEEITPMLQDYITSLPEGIT